MNAESIQVGTSTVHQSKSKRRAPRYYVLVITSWSGDTWKIVSEHPTRAGAEQEAKRRSHNGVLDDGSTDAALVCYTQVATYSQVRREFRMTDDDIEYFLVAEFDFQMSQHEVRS